MWRVICVSDGIYIYIYRVEIYFGNNLDKGVCSVCSNCCVVAVATIRLGRNIILRIHGILLSNDLATQFPRVSASIAKFIHYQSH